MRTLLASLLLFPVAQSCVCGQENPTDWPAEIKKVMEPNQSVVYRRYSIESLDLVFSEDRKGNSNILIFRRDRPSPWALFDKHGIDIWDKDGRIITGTSLQSGGSIDNFSYAAQHGNTFVYYSDNNMDGILDVITTHHPDSKPFIPPQVRVNIDGEWHLLTNERCFEGEWVTEDSVRMTEVFREKKKISKDYYRTKTPDGFRFVHFDSGMPVFVESVP